MIFKILSFSLILNKREFKSSFWTLSINLGIIENIYLMLEQFLWTFSYAFYPNLRWDIEKAKKLINEINIFNIYIFQTWAFLIHFQARYLYILEIFCISIIALNRLSAFMFPFDYERVKFIYIINFN